jgi:predicted DNA-binding transcriptional regulator AlpA
VKAGKFPAPAKISRSITAWNLGDVRRWRAGLFPVANSTDTYLGDRS